MISMSYELSSVAPAIRAPGAGALGFKAWPETKEARPIRQLLRYDGAVAGRAAAEFRPLIL
jgi:hypothetical protein